jgi:tRNA (cmo5U34)-methyltransferase
MTRVEKMNKHNEKKLDRLFQDPGRRGGKFVFDHHVAEVFDDMLVRSVPFYDEMQGLITDLAGQFCKPGTSVYDLGSSTGTTLGTLANACPIDNLSYIGVDASSAMIEVAQSRLGEIGSVSFLQHDLNCSLRIENASFVILNLTLQFVDPINRQRCLTEIFEGLNPGGGVCLIEKIDVDSGFATVYESLYHAFKKRQGYSDMEIKGKQEAIKGVLNPSTVNHNEQLLKNAGFSQIDMFFRWLNFAGWVGVKS